MYIIIMLFVHCTIAESLFVGGCVRLDEYYLSVMNIVDLGNIYKQGISFLSVSLFAVLYFLTL